jgi:hypothetical protein
MERMLWRAVEKEGGMGLAAGGARVMASVRTRKSEKYARDDGNPGLA